MTADDTTTAPPVGMDGSPLLGLVTRSETLPLEQRPERPKREMPNPMNKRPPKPTIDPLDKAAQEVHGLPVSLEAYDNQIMWCVIARVDGGPWSHLLAAENIRAATFSSQRRAEATLWWFRRQAELDGNGCEYRIIPVMRGEKQI